jgi:putative ATP-binding cassette transporter
MTLLRFLSLAPLRVTTMIALTGVISGLCSAAILAVINRALYASADAMGPAIVMMVLLIAAKIATNAISRWLLVKYAQETLTNLSIDLCRKVLAAPLRLVEQTGAHRVLTALTTDVPTLGVTLQTLPTLAVNSAVIIGCVCYLGWLYPMGLLALIAAVLVGMGVYWGLHTDFVGAIARARERRDDLMGSFREVTEGIKELKLNRRRREEFVADRLEAVAGQLKDENLVATRKYLYLDSWSQGLFYLMLAGILLLFPRDRANASEILTGFAFAALYMMNPAWAMIGSVPTLLAGANSLKKLDEMGLAFRDPGAENDARAARPAAPLADKLELANVRFRYEREDGEFHLGPIDLELGRGEVVFLIGGNGSGKTTLVKLLTGLYWPDSGDMRLNGETVDEAQADWYRQHFACVFFDFHLFDRLLGAHQADVDALANRYIEDLELGQKVTVAERAFSTTNLSQGQRKRLALLTALIEERPICVFDEWAADQDPHYKEVFYSRILPMLKAQGKIVVVVTHDDRFFHHGDRVIKLDDGKIDVIDRRRIKTA